MCVDRTTINWMVTIHFITFGLGGALCWRMPDKLGPRNTFKIFGSLHILCHWIILMVPNYYMRMFAFGFMGFCMLKNSVCYMWLFSLVDSKNKPIACSILNAWDTVTMAVCCAYF